MADTEHDAIVEAPDPAVNAPYMVERLRDMSEQVNAGHDRYIPNLADDAAELIGELVDRIRSLEAALEPFVDDEECRREGCT